MAMSALYLLLFMLISSPAIGVGSLSNPVLNRRNISVGLRRIWTPVDPKHCDPDQPFLLARNVHRRKHPDVHPLLASVGSTAANSSHPETCIATNRILSLADLMRSLLSLPSILPKIGGHESPQCKDAVMQTPKTLRRTPAPIHTLSDPPQTRDPMVAKRGVRGR
jgi:hypothetical protein